MDLTLALTATDGRVLGNGFFWNGHIVTAAHVARHAAGQPVVLRGEALWFRRVIEILDVAEEADLALCVAGNWPPNFNLVGRIVDLPPEQDHEVNVGNMRPTSHGRFEYVQRHAMLRYVPVPECNGGGHVWIAESRVYPGDSGGIVQLANGAGIVGIVLGNPTFRPLDALVSPLYQWLSAKNNMVVDARSP